MSIKHDTNSNKRKQDMGDVEEGYKVTVYRGNNHPIEQEVFCRIIKKFGIHWNMLHYFLPWYTKVNLRSAFVSLAGENSISEYKNIKMDPMKIREFNRSRLHKGFDDGVHQYKNGHLVNKDWSIDNKRREEIRTKNKELYGISEEESAKITIPLVLSADSVGDEGQLLRLKLLIKKAILMAYRAQKARQEYPKIDLNGADVINSKSIQRRPGASIKIKYRREPIHATTKQSLLFKLPEGYF